MNKLLEQIIYPGVEIKIWETRSTFPDFYTIESYVEETKLIRVTKKVDDERELGEAQFARMLEDAWHWEISP